MTRVMEGVEFTTFVVVCITVCLQVNLIHLAWTDVPRPGKDYLLGFFLAKTGNVLRCKRLCEYNSACVGINYDVRKRICYFMDVSHPTNLGELRNYFSHTLNRSSLLSHEVCRSNTCGRFEFCVPAAGIATDNNCVKEPSLCPVVRGYSLQIYSDRTLCLKANFIKVNYTDAMRVCEGDGGHMALIDSNTTRLRFSSFLETSSFLQNIDITGKERVYFDGRDVNDDDVFYTWNGDVMPWIAWAAHNPLKGTRNCLRGKQKDGFLSRDGYCYFENYFVCQIDL